MSEDTNAISEIDKTVHEPLVQRRGWLRNGNKPGNPSLAPRCGAKARRTGQPCKAPAMKNGKCRLHGGKSTGPRTTEGKLKVGQAHLKSGLFTREAKAAKEELRSLIKACRVYLKAVG